MIKNVKLANRLILATVLLLAIASIVLVAVDWASGSTSLLLELVRQILLVLALVALLLRSIVNKDSAFTRYLILAVIMIFLISLIVFAVHHPTREWP